MNVLTATGTRVQVIPHRTHSALASGVVRLHAPGAMLDLPYREHVRRDGRLIVQLHRIALDTPLLEALCEALRGAAAHQRNTNPDTED